MEQAAKVKLPSDPLSPRNLERILIRWTHVGYAGVAKRLARLSLSYPGWAGLTACFPSGLF